MGFKVYSGKGKQRSAERYKARRRGLHVGHPPKLAPDQLDDARRMIVEGEGTMQVARSLGVNPSTLRRLLMKG
jgi:DNA invertase Pin-like site-specific DNA recombinase